MRGLSAHRDGDVSVVTLDDDGVVVTVELDLAPHANRVGVLANALVEHGLVRTAVVLSTSEAAGNRTSSGTSSNTTRSIRRPSSARMPSRSSA